MALSAKTAAGLAAATMLTGATAPAFSQTAGWAGLPMQATVMRNLLNNATHGQAGPYAPGPRPAPAWPPGGGSVYAGPPRGLRPAGPSSLPYADNPAVTARVLDTFIGNVRARSGPAAADRLQQLFARTDFRAEWSRMVAADGLRRGDLIDAVSAYWVLNWMIVHHADNNRAQTLGARAQVARAIADSPGVARLDSAGRQAMAETLMLQQVVQAALYKNALRTHDQASLQTLSAGAERNFNQAFGMNLAAYNLTDQGFVAAG